MSRTYKVFYLRLPYLSEEFCYYTCQNKRQAARYFCSLLRELGPRGATFSVGGIYKIIHQLHL